jgi:Fe-S oxidoreductase
VTEVVLETSPVPQRVGSILLFFTSLDAAARAAVELSSRRLRACDLMDRRHLSLAREMDPRYELLIPPEAEAVLLVECEAQSQAELVDSIREIESLIVSELELASASHLAADEYDQELVWQLARRFSRTLNRLRGTTRPVPYVEDVAVPPAELPEFLQNALEALRRRQITASLFAHAAHGQVHIRPFIDLADGEEVSKLHDLADELYEAVWKLGGTISGEHAEGYSRTPFIARQHGPLAAAFKEVKSLFDPLGTLNPGKKVPSEPDPVVGSLRRFSYPLVDRMALPAPSHNAAPSLPAEAEPKTPMLQLAWEQDEMSYAARMCNGCAVCRTQSSDTRMCPIFRFAPREEASPRAKANLARGVLTGTLPEGAVVEDACKEIVDLCVHCHMCRIECPASVDIPKLMMEAKADYVAVNGQDFHEWALTRIDGLCSAASKISRIANWAIANRPVRWVMEKTLGIAQGRKLPKLARRPFLQSNMRRRLAHSRRTAGDKVLFFVDTYANYCDAQLAEAMVKVLEHNGVSVYIPERQREAGMPLISHGALGPARKIAEMNVALLAEGVRQGYTIVSTEPSAILALTREYLHLLGPDSDVQLVADNAMEACHYLWRFHQRGKLQLNFQVLDLTVAYHAPCHLKALEIGLPSVNLLGLIPGVRVRRVEKGCSGMAGIFGFQKKNYRTSLRAGLSLMTELRTGGYHVGVTECSTCRVQMEQSSTMPTIHPVKLLALAYGLMPELRASINSPTEALVVK